MTEESVLRFTLQRLNAARKLVCTELNTKQIENSGIHIPSNTGPCMPRRPLILLFVKPSGDGPNENQAKNLVNMSKQKRFEIYASNQKYAWIPLLLSTEKQVTHKGMDYGPVNETTAIVFIDYMKLDFIHSLSEELINAFFQSHYIFSEIWIVFDGTFNAELPIMVTKHFQTLRNMFPFLCQRVHCNIEDNDILSSVER